MLWLARAAPAATSSHEAFCLKSASAEAPVQSPYRRRFKAKLTKLNGPQAAARASFRSVTHSRAASSARGPKAPAAIGPIRATAAR